MLSGCDDEFVAVVTKGMTSIRFGELVGLETEFVRQSAIRIEWQLYELDSGEFVRVPPKDDSYRTIDTPDFLSDLLPAHIAATKPQPCPLPRQDVAQPLGARGQSRLRQLRAFRPPLCKIVSRNFSRTVQGSSQGRPP